MKKLSLLLSFSVLCLTAWPALAERFGTLAGFGDGMVLQDNETALVVYASGSTEMFYQKKDSSIVRFTVSGNSINNISPLPLVGPATLTCRSADAVIGFRIVPTTGSQDGVWPCIPANAVVIPTDATGGVEVILESSADMVKWTPALPGTYGNTSANRFFRVRAVQKP